jgi:hypothetical protein
MTNRVSVGALVCVVASFGAGCERSSPIRPAPVTAEADGASGTAAGEIVFHLDEGTMTLTAGKGTIQGVYAGHATGSGRDQRAQVTVVLTGGTGQFSDAFGNLVGVGTGAFAEEGDFSIVLVGTISTPEASRHVRASVRGTSTISCLGETPVVSQEGTGAISGTGKISGTLVHHVTSNFVCGG